MLGGFHGTWIVCFNIDGKTLRHSYDSTNEKSAIRMISARASQAGINLGQPKVNNKSNGITAIPELFDLLEIEEYRRKCDHNRCYGFPEGDRSKDNRPRR